MKKKEYIRPEICVVQMEVHSILTNSQISVAQESDYEEEEIDDYWDSGKGIWAD